jgi:hypothetical protein
MRRNPPQKFSLSKWNGFLPQRSVGKQRDFLSPKEESRGRQRETRKKKGVEHKKEIDRYKKSHPQPERLRVTTFSI